MDILYKEFNWDNDNLRLYSLFKDYKNCFLLDSSLNSNKNGRFSFIGFDPFYILKSKNKNSFYNLRQLLKKYQIKNNHYLPFLGGVVGYFAYDLAQVLERKINLNAEDDLQLPDLYFGFYDVVIAIDHLRKKLIIISSGFPEKNGHFREARAKERLNFVRSTLNNYTQGYTQTSAIKVSSLKSNFTKENYLKAVNKVLYYIAKGDIYQVNLSQRFFAKIDCQSFDLFRRLRKFFPTNFAGYFDAGDFQIISASPERFLRVENGLVETIPMKGTRRRGKNKSQDLLFKKNLLRSKKDKAELLMIVDLLRNDLGKVCDYDSVRVIKKRVIEKYRTVFQATSTITGKLYRDKDNIDLIMAALPGGSISGCPKIRAIEIIDEIEPTRRSIYTGSFGYLSFSGNMDLNILIRTFLKKRDKIYFQVGGGIVSDSNPLDEYQETLIKAGALIEVLGAG